jgi:hypothetical protein
MTNAAQAKVIKAFQGAIKAAWQRKVPAIILTGKKLIEAKKVLGHGRWGKLFEGPNAPPFGLDVAEALMRIARHPTLAKPEHVPNLPAAWSTLEVLARAKPKHLERWLLAGTANAAMTRHEAESLVSPPPPAAVLDPEGTPHEIDAQDLPLYGASAERTQVLKALAKSGFDMSDVADEMLDIARGTQATRTPAPRIDETWMLRKKIDQCIAELEVAKVLTSSDAEFQRWVMSTAARLRRLLDKR